MVQKSGRVCQPSVKATWPRNKRRHPRIPAPGVCSLKNVSENDGLNGIESGFSGARRHGPRGRGEGQRADGGDHGGAVPQGSLHVHEEERHADREDPTSGLQTKYLYISFPYNVLRNHGH